MDVVKVKLVTMGPQRCGKTRVANLLAGVDETPDLNAYDATVGVRILEFDKTVERSGGRATTQLKVELWDASGDKKYENCWPAILKGAGGVLMVYDPNVSTQQKDIELWHRAFVKPLNLRSTQVLCLAHARAAIGSKAFPCPRALEKENIAFAVTTLDSIEGASNLRAAFDKYCAGVAKAVMEKSKAEVDAAMDAVR